jgi:2-polyprenyl-6-methoxyphenol hydroxylase-like FAD-dependent oxidoreductase
VWAEAVSHGVQSKAVLSGSPIAEYQPALLAKGHVAIIGDAAHTVSPMTGSGFASAVEDAAALARLLVENSANESVVDALARYELVRLAFSRSLVASSQRARTEFVGCAQSPI